MGTGQMSEGFWVFGYGSLMWRPGFPYVERCAAELPGHRRSFCLKSVRYRGTHEKPGLVLGLEPKLGTLCRGVAYRVRAEDAVETHAYLYDREMDRGSYFETYQTLTLADDRRVEALCYVIDPNNPDYYRDMTLEQKAGIIAEAVGPAGANRDYLFNTHNDLKEMLVEDSEVEALVKHVARLTGREASDVS